MNTTEARKILRDARKLGTKISGTDTSGVSHTGCVVARTGTPTAITYVIESDRTGERVTLSTVVAL